MCIFKKTHEIVYLIQYTSEIIHKLTRGFCQYYANKCNCLKCILLGFKKKLDKIETRKSNSSDNVKKTYFKTSVEMKRSSNGVKGFISNIYK